MRTTIPNRFTGAVNAVCAVFILLSCLLGTQSCHRDNIYDPQGRAKIPVTIDWTASKLNPQQATVMVWDLDRGTLTELPTLESPNNYTEVWLQMGNYALLAMNETMVHFEQYDTHQLEFRNKANYSQFGVYCQMSKKVNGNTIGRGTRSPLYSDEYDLHDTPDTMAIATLDRFTVTANMVEYSEKGSGVVPDFYKDSRGILLAPRRITTLISVDIYLNKSHYLQRVMPGRGDMFGFAKGMTFKDLKTSPEQVIHGEYYNFVRFYDADSTGWINSKYLVFAPLDDAPKPEFYWSVFFLQNDNGVQNPKEQEGTMGWINRLLKYQSSATWGSDATGQQTANIMVKTITPNEPKGPPSAFNPDIGDWGNEDVDVGVVPKITFYLEGGIGNFPTITSANGSVVRIPDAVPTKSGHSFLYWSMKPDGTGTRLNPGDGYVMPAFSVRLYAIYKPAP